MNKTIALAFSGGLDTSFCVPYLRDQGWDVVTVTVDTGGFSARELGRIEARSKTLGAVRHITVDAREELFDRYLRYLVYGNVLRGHLYPLSVSAERVCQAAKIAAVARDWGAGAIAHGSTGAGNDQLRFDIAFRVIVPELEIVTPIRDGGFSRDQEAACLREHGIEVPEKTAAYSVNRGLWGASVGGRETTTSDKPLPPEAWPGRAVGDSPSRSLTLVFERGVPTGLDGETLPPVALIRALASIASGYGIGRGIHLGDAILGIKGRVGFEAPAATLLIAAHRELEKLVLSAGQQQWKETLGSLYGNLLHEARFFDPLARDLEAFLESSQTPVTGEVSLSLYPRTWEVNGVRSPNSLMNPDVANYGEGNKFWDGTEARAFSKLYGLSQMLTAQARHRVASS
ncbi:MAG: argininosuccinate synthase [Gammaproteobacteria bacterium]